MVADMIEVIVISVGFGFMLGKYFKRDYDDGFIDGIEWVSKRKSHKRRSKMYTSKQMLDMATHFWNKQHSIEIVPKSPGKPGAWAVMVSDSEAVTPNLELVPIESIFSAPSNVFYPTLEKAFAIMEAYITKKKEE